MPRTSRNPRDLVFEEAGDEPDRDIVVDLSERRAAPPRFRLVNDELVDDNPEVAPFEEEEGDHDENLAEKLDENFLRDLGMDVLDYIEDDIQARAPWRDRFERGMEQLGLVESDIDDGPFPGASNVVHPLILDAVTQFWARACGEFLPSEGPAKSKIHGQETPELVDRSERVAEFMNYDMMTGDAGFVSEKSKLFWALPWAGSGFTKTFRNPIDGQVTGIYVPAEDMILHASSSDLRVTPRFTHRMKKTLNELKALQLNGYYRDVDLLSPASEDLDEVEQTKNEINDIEPNETHDRDNRLTIFECLVELDLPGYEHKDDQGRPTGWELPYYVTVEQESGEILAIRRGWKRDDPTYKRRIYFRKYDFVPGPGAYGLGFFHLIGGLQAAATGALRVMLDSAAAASLSGGFVSKNANLKGERLIFEPGVWKPVNATAENLAQAFVSPPVKEPSAALFQLLGFITEQGNKFAATTDMQTGNTDSKNAPVGSTVALLEQGQKVMSTIHRLTHAEFARELKDRYDLHAEDAPETGYPYDVGGESRTVYREDFAPGVEIVPVSDPNIFSSVQRIQLAQTIWQVAAEHPDTFKKKEAGRFLLQALKIPDIERFIEPDPEAMPYDANGEIQALLHNKPIKVLPEQNHVAHLSVIAAFVQNPQFGGNDLVMQQVAPALSALAATHLAYAWAAAAREQGVPAGFINPETGQMEQAQVPPEQITAMMAQIMPALLQAQGVPNTGAEGENGDAEMLKVQAQVQGDQAKLEMKREEHQMKMQHEAEKLQWERQKAELQMQLETMKAQMKAQAEQQKQAIQTQQMQQQAVMDQQMQQQEMQNQQQQMQQQAQMDQQRMGMEQQQMQREGQMKEAQMGQEMQHAERKSQMDMQRQSQRPQGRPGNDGGAPR